jgi:hypothetical protein
MNRLSECAHEREVLDLVLSDRWPDRCDPDMVTHAAECAVCADVVAVALAMREDESRVEADIVAASPQHPSVVPDATLVWWRAQLRAQEDAGRRAARPIAMVQGIGIGIGLVAAFSFARVSWPWIRGYFAGATSNLADAAARGAASSGAAIAAVPLWLTVGIVAALIAAPIAVYAALGRD